MIKDQLIATMRAADALDHVHVTRVDGDSEINDNGDLVRLLVLWPVNGTAPPTLEIRENGALVHRLIPMRLLVTTVDICRHLRAAGATAGETQNGIETRGALRREMPTETEMVLEVLSDAVMNQDTSNVTANEATSGSSIQFQADPVIFPVTKMSGGKEFLLRGKEFLPVLLRA